MKFVCGKCKREKTHEQQRCVRCGSPQTNRLTPRDEAELIAAGVMRLLEPACSRLVVAGSLRRGAPFVKDIELVAQPLLVEPEKTLFGCDEDKLVSALDGLVSRLAEVPTRPAIRFNQKLRKNGPRQKALVADGKIAIDLFVVLPPASWGATLAIRTGPHEFNIVMMTKRIDGGAMPNHLHHANGTLWDRNVLLSADTEEDYFKLLGLPCWRPDLRTAERLRTHLQLERNRDVSARTQGR